MDGFRYREGELHVGEVPVAAIAETAGTPTYIYSAEGIRTAWDRLQQAFAPLGAKPHYALKACANLHVCRLLRSLGAGMDVVSGGELERAWLAGAPMDDIAFAGVGKTDAELRAALDGRHSPLLAEAENFAAKGFGQGDIANRGPVGMINVESPSELERLATLAAELGVRAKTAIRINPNVDPRTHEYITTGKEHNKFGIDADQVPALFERFAGHPGLELMGLHAHIGSLVREVEPYLAAVRVLTSLIDILEEAGHPISLLDLGGGFAVDYQSGEAPPLASYVEAIEPLLRQRIDGGLQITIEPGRSIMANAGILLTRVHHVKQGKSKRFVVCDAGMQTLIRPALYRAFHFLWPTKVAPEHLLDLPRERAEAMALPGLHLSEVVGPICESSDFLARDRQLPPMDRGDLLAVFSAGAYGMSLASNYNDHGRPAEVLVDGGKVTLINQRQPLARLFETEMAPKELAFS